MVIFSLLYGVISYTFAYYGEMVTYLGMTMPMAVVALVSWLRNPYKGNRAEVKVNVLGKKETVFMWLLTAAVTVVFYYILMYFNTKSIVLSTLSVTTSFAVYVPVGTSEGVRRIFGALRTRVSSLAASEPGSRSIR